MTSSVILGANGQDGSYLCDILAGPGHHVWGVALEDAPRYRDQDDAFRYVRCDLRDEDALRRVLEESHADEIYHVAAVHGASGFRYEEVWSDALDVNVKSLHAVLEYVRKQDRKVRVFYAGSGKVFGTPFRDRISILSPRRADCLYSVTKLAAENLINFYIREHDVHACLGYLFNHESVRRSENYFIPSIMRILASTLQDPGFKGQIHTLDFYCDWGYALEYMQMAVDLLQRPEPCNVILATGRTLYARNFVETLFANHGLDYQEHITETAGKTDAGYYEVDIQHTLEHLGYGPAWGIHEVCEEIL